MVSGHSGYENLSNTHERGHVLVTPSVRAERMSGSMNSSDLVNMVVDAVPV